MRLTALVLCLILLLPAAQAAPVTFSPPAAFEGQHGTWGSTGVLVAFRPTTHWTLQVESDEVGVALRHRYVYIDDPVPGTYEQSLDPEPIDSEWSRLRLQPAEDIATLVIHADSVRAAGVVDADVRIRDGIINEEWPYAWWKPAIRKNLDVGVASTPVMEASVPPSSITFTGLRSIEWTHASVSCNGDCPRAEDTEVTIDHIQQFLSNGTATLTGTADFVAFLGPLDLSFQGTARLPRAVGSLDCPNCTVEDATLTVHGSIDLRNVSASGGSFSADMGGAYSVRVGETPVGRVTGREAAVATVAVLAGLALLAKLAAALISKRIQEKPLEQETRSGVFEAIEANPAVTRADLMRLTGIKNGQMVHHERVLVETGQVQAWKRGRTTHYAVRGMDRREAMRRRARDDPDLSEVLAFVAEHARSPQAAVVQWARERFGWSPSTLQDKLHLLLDVGLVERERQGRMSLYSVPAAPASPAVPTP